LELIFALAGAGDSAYLSIAGVAFLDDFSRLLSSLSCCCFKRFLLDDELVSGLTRFLLGDVDGGAAAASSLTSG
jgi:hypothetical protein